MKPPLNQLKRSSWSFLGTSKIQRMGKLVGLGPGGLDSWNPPPWKGLLVGCTPSNHQSTNSNQQLTISWKICQEKTNPCGFWKKSNSSLTRDEFFSPRNNASILIFEVHWGGEGIPPSKVWRSVPSLKPTAKAPKNCWLGWLFFRGELLVLVMVNQLQ